MAQNEVKIIFKGEGDLLKQVKELNNKVWDSGKDLLHLYDDFNDKQAGKRIIDYILKNEK